MIPVSISRLHDYVICTVCRNRIPQDRLIDISEISGKYNRSGFSIFGSKHFNRRRSKQMSDIRKPNRNPITQFNFLIIITGNQKPYRRKCIFHRIQRYIRFPAGTFGFPVSPLCLKLLDMCTVTQHDRTEFRSRFGCKYLSAESVGIKHRQKTCMINMCMGKQYVINFCRIHRNFLIFKQISSLFHTNVYTKTFIAYFKIMTTSCHFVSSPKKF